MSQKILRLEGDEIKSVTEKVAKEMTNEVA